MVGVGGDMYVALSSIDFVASKINHLSLKNLFWKLKLTVSSESRRPVLIYLISNVEKKLKGKRKKMWNKIF